MGRRHPNHKLVKIHFPYTVEEAARCLGIHKHTVRRWIKDGLPTIDDRRPTVMRGRDLAEFLENRRKTRKQTCPPGHLYCVKCREPRQPAGDFAEYMPMTAEAGNLRGICPVCDRLMHRRVSLEKLGQVRGRLEIAIQEARSHIRESNSPSVNGDLRQGQ